MTIAISSVVSPPSTSQEPSPRYSRSCLKHPGLLSCLYHNHSQLCQYRTMRRMVSWFILIIMLTSVRGWDFQKIFNLSDGLVPLRNGKMQIPLSVVNGHAKPKSSDKTYPTNQPKRNSTTPSNKGQFLVPWVPHLAKNISVVANKNYSLQDTNIEISVTKS